LPSVRGCHPPEVAIRPRFVFARGGGRAASAAAFDTAGLERRSLQLKGKSEDVPVFVVTTDRTGAKQEVRA
jgi:hypothetical protein